MKLEHWQKRNTSFKPKCVFKIGDHCGFFSEYNNMVFAIHYCIVNKYKFILSSKWANFRYKNGWNDYFEPFCEEKNFILDYYYFNDRQRYNPIRKKEEYKGYLYFLLFGWIYTLYCFFYNIRLFTWNLDDKYRKQSVKECFNIPELELHNTLSENCKAINNAIWRYNKITKEEIDKLIPVVDSPYVSIHVRRGDKNTEIAHTSLDKYISALEQQTTNRLCFVATDDYSVYNELCEQYPEWHFFTITRPEEKGFNEYAYNGRNIIAKHNELIELFATIEIMAKSEWFVGTMSSNIGMYMYWRMPQGRCLGVDYNEWRIW